MFTRTLKHLGSVKSCLPVISAALLLAGCNDPKTSARVDALEQQVAQQQTQLAALEAQTIRVDHEISLLHTNLADALGHSENALAMLFELEQRMDRLLIVMEQAATNKPASVRYYVPAQPATAAQRHSPQSTRMGIPAAVYQQISTDAARKWPGNYEMQEYEIKEQVSAWKNLHQ